MPRLFRYNPPLQLFSKKMTGVRPSKIFLQASPMKQDPLSKTVSLSPQALPPTSSNSKMEGTGGFLKLVRRMSKKGSTPRKVGCRAMRRRGATNLCLPLCEILSTAGERYSRQQRDFRHPWLALRGCPALLQYPMNEFGKLPLIDRLHKNPFDTNLAYNFRGQGIVQSGTQDNRYISPYETHFP